METKKIIVAPLNWGLGHATRCIPIIISLLEKGFTPVIASDGDALDLLQKEFPDLESISLPSYNIQYKKRLKLGLFLQIPRLKKTIRKEKQIIGNYLNEHDVHGIISDNRFGVRNKNVPSVYITHQLRVLSGITTIFTSAIHQRIIRKFDECWVPDVEGNSNLAGRLSQLKNTTITIKHLGILSRFESESVEINNDILILLSGPEPQRSKLEKLLLKEFAGYQARITLVRGKMAAVQTTSHQGNILVYNFVLSEKLQELINSSALVICRSGYSSILDLAKLSKKAFFIPTPGQTEQEYLANNLKAKKIAPFAKQDDFSKELLDKVDEYSGFKMAQFGKIRDDLFDLFKCKRKG